MIYPKVKKGIFLERPNRFIAKVQIDDKIETCHVKNTGRCRELFLPGVEVYVEDHGVLAHRKTRYSVICVKKGSNWVNIDSQVPNKLAVEWLKEGKLFPTINYLKSEVKYGNSRFDIYIEAVDRKIFMEVKGVTLEENGVARFPDAPTERGVKHIKELMECKKEGYEAYLLFVIQMKGVQYFEPNDTTHKAFGDALREASHNGINILAVDCQVSTDSIIIDEYINVRLDEREWLNGADTD